MLESPAFQKFALCCFAFMKDNSTCFHYAFSYAVEQDEDGEYHSAFVLHFIPWLA